MRSRLLSITSYGDGAHYIRVLWQWGHVVRRKASCFHLPRLRGAGDNAGCASIAGCCNCHSGFFAMALICASGKPSSIACASAVRQRVRMASSDSGNRRWMYWIRRAAQYRQ